MHVKDIFLATVDQPQGKRMREIEEFLLKIQIGVAKKEKERLERQIGIRPAWWKFW